MSFVPFEEFDPADRERLRRAVLARALYWFKVAQMDLQQTPSSPDWLEALAECCSSLNELTNTTEEPEKGISLDIVLMNALNDLKQGLLPQWMKPTTFPPSRRPPSRRQSQLRGLMVDSVRGLQELFGLDERTACKKLAGHFEGTSEMTAEQIRSWARSGLYESFCDLVNAVGLYTGSTVPDWLDATMRAYKLLARYPDAKSQTQHKHSG